MSGLSGRGDLTDEQWERLRRWIPAPAWTGRPIIRPDRVLADKGHPSRAHRAYLRRRYYFDRWLERRNPLAT